MCLKNGLYCVLSKVSLDCCCGGYDFVLSCCDFLESLPDAVFALKENYCLRIADYCNFGFFLGAVMLVDECSCEFADLSSEIGIIEHPVSVSVGHGVVPAHDFDSEVAGLCTCVLYGVCVRRVNHDEVAAC